MKKAKFLRRLLSIAISFMLIASAIGTGVFSAAAEETAETESGIYQLLQFTGKYRWTTSGIACKNELTNIAEGKSLNRVSANYDMENGARIYIDCKTPEEANFDLENVHSVAYYLKNETGKDIDINFQNFTDKDTENGWLTHFGRLANCPVYLVRNNSRYIKAAATGDSGTITIPAEFEGYVVYETGNRSIIETDLVSDLLTSSDYTFGDAMAFVVSTKLNGGDVFYYGEISANTLTAEEFITGIKPDGMYTYAVTNGLTGSGLDAGTTVETIYSSTLDENVTTFAYPSGTDQWKSQSIFFKVNGIKDFYKYNGTINTVSMYVKNTSDELLKLGLFKDNNYNFLYGWFSYYDINTQVMTERKYSGPFSVPAGFEGYVFFDATQVNNERGQYTFPNICADVLNAWNLKLYQNNSSTIFGKEISIGDVTAWRDSYQDVKKVFADKSNTVAAGMTYGFGGSGKGSKTQLTESVVSGLSFDGDAYKYEVAAEFNGLHNMHYELVKCPAGDYVLQPEFIANRDAAVIWLKNGNESNFEISMFQDNPWTTFKISYRLFDTEKLTISEGKTGNIILPAGFTGYAVISLDETMVTQGEVTKSWKQFVVDGGKLTNPAFRAKLDAHPVGDTYYIGRLTFVKSLNEFFESRINVTLAGDANKDGLADIRDMVRLKKYAAGIAETSVYMPNISYGGNSDAAAAATLTSLKKQLMGVANEDVYVSDAVRTALIPEEPEEEDIRTAANDEVGNAIYHMSVGNWDKLYGESIAAETEFLNYYAGGDISDVRTIKERDGAAWIFVASSALEEDSAARTNLAKYVETLKAEKLWNTVTGFEFEEIAGTEENVTKFANLSAWLNKNYPEKRQFAVLAVGDIDVATPEAYKYVTDIAFDWYTPETTAEMREMFEKMKTNTGLTNAKYWFLPGVYTTSPSETAATHALAQLNVCYELLAEQKPENRGGLYYYNWKTFTNGDGTSSAYGLDQLLQYDTFKPVADRILEVSGKLDNKMTFTVLNEGGTINEAVDRWFDFSAEFKEMRNNGTMPDFNTFSYYFKNSSEKDVWAQLWLDQNWHLLVGIAYAYDINNGTVTKVNGEFKLPAGFEGYVCYDLTNCTVTVNGEKKAATEMFKTTYSQALRNVGSNQVLEIRNISLSTESFANVDIYFKSLIKNIVVNKGGAYVTAEDGGKDVWLNFSQDFKDMISSGTVPNLKTFSYYFKNSSENDVWAHFWLTQKWYTLTGTAYAYDINNGTITKVSGGFKLPAGFEGYVCYDLNNCTMTVNGEEKAAVEMFRTSIDQILRNMGTNQSLEIRNITLGTEDFEKADSYFKSLIKS